NNEYSKDILNLLYETINEEKVLNYYLEDEQNLDKVLDIFIRTNDGGTKLTFSDLLMSFLTVHWSDARENFEELIREVNQFGDFSITIDFILKNM
ncbi:GmrSD restriction endonuclease domain-containing protein, partial [Enterococcus faecalis]